MTSIMNGFKIIEGIESLDLLQAISPSYNLVPILQESDTAQRKWCVLSKCQVSPSIHVAQPHPYQKIDPLVFRRVSNFEWDINDS